MKITFGLVIYNEEERIERCLNSVREVADEIIIVHDGICTDKTLEIAKKFTDKIFVRERLMGSDPHRLYILEKANNDWVFMIDADEFLSSELCSFLKGNPNLEKCSACAFKWPIWDGAKYATTSNYRPCLFNKKKCWAIGLHNFSIQAAGQVCKFDYVLEHRPAQSKIGLGLVFSTLSSRCLRDAERYAIGYEGLQKYNENLIPQSFKNWFKRYVKFPIFYAILNLFKHFLGSLKNNYLDGLSGLKISLQLGLYQFKLAYNIWKIQKRLK